MQLRYFQTIAQYESVTQAAAFYHIPQSAMSQTLSRLEKELGHKLFERKNNRIYLNNHGRVFLEAVNTAIASLEMGQKALAEVDSEIGGTINVLVLENHRFLVHCVSEFSKLYPNVHFNIMHEYSSDASCDICVFSGKVFKRMQNAVPLISERIILCVHENHPLAQRESISLKELSSERFITTGLHSALYDITVKRCAEAGFEPNITIVCDDPYFVRKYVSLNMGVSLTPSVSWAGRFRENTRLIPVHDPELITTSYLLTDSHQYISPSVKAFLAFAVSESKTIEGNLLS